MLLVLLVGLAPAPAGSASVPTAVEARIGAHSMLYLEHPFSAKEAMFRQAAAMGASTIRVDVCVSGVFHRLDGTPDWTGVDQYVSLSRKYHLRVLAVVYGTPVFMAQRPWDYHDPPSDPCRWGELVGAIAAHTRGWIENFEVVNEPDSSWAFHGTPQQYAAMLRCAHDAISRVNPSARVVLGGLMHSGAAGRQWLEQVLATPGAGALHRFDIANIHVRCRAASAASIISRWRRYFASKHFTGPLWVTEAGYPADPAYQTDPAYQGGPAAQARYLKNVIPAMLRAGATKVFVTERDSLTGRFASEGVLDTSDPLTANPVYTRRPSFYTVRWLIRSSNS